MNRTSVKKYRKDLEEALKRVAEKHNAEISIGAIRYGDSEATCKITLNVIPEDGTSIEQQKFNRACGRYGLKPEHYGEIFSYHTGAYKLVGLNPRAKKFPVIGEEVGSGGKRYKFGQGALRQIVPDL